MHRSSSSSTQVGKRNRCELLPFSSNNFCVGRVLALSPESTCTDKYSKTYQPANKGVGIICCIRPAQPRALLARDWSQIAKSALNRMRGISCKTEWCDPHLCV